jgi:hypothetical protein
VFRLTRQHYCERFNSISRRSSIRTSSSRYSSCSSGSNGNSNHLFSGPTQPQAGGSSALPPPSGVLRKSGGNKLHTSNSFADPSHSGAMKASAAGNELGFGLTSGSGLGGGRVHRHGLCGDVELLQALPERKSKSTVGIIGGASSSSSENDDGDCGPEGSVTDKSQGSAALV